MTELTKQLIGNGVNSATFRPTGSTTYTFYAYGTFASATATLQVSYDGGVTWFAMRDKTNTTVALTSDGMFSDVQFIANGAIARVNTAGGGGGTSITVGVTRNAGV